MTTDGFFAEWDGHTLTVWASKKHKGDCIVAEPNANGIRAIKATGEWKHPPIVGARIDNVQDEAWTWPKVANALAGLLGRAGGGPVWAAAKTCTDGTMAALYEREYGRVIPC